MKMVVVLSTCDKTTQIKEIDERSILEVAFLVCPAFGFWLLVFHSRRVPSSLTSNFETEAAEKNPNREAELKIIE